MTALVVGAVLTVGIAVLVAMNMWWSRDAHGISVSDIHADLAHRAPARPLSADRAHELTQKHKSCSAEDCACKRAALRAQIRAGRMTPTNALHELLFNRFGDEEPIDRPRGSLQ
ncbi:hypothetical protein IU469_32365 [Nocardia puris]|uniref:Uncharacterized protein n=1 Tax=Nocardia puris TaxID=208602 RepID=A0A366D567_9NOCA|nr:hypothetical protein [Nocardia puris]MBF6370362.1 hypothetical protein [Nocardia puris]RBO85170.1 hypothetical protein DFR74_11518 [Nocardia puris]